MIAWTATFVLTGLALLIIAANLVAGILAERRGRNYSAFPFVAGILGCAACLVCPLSIIKYFAWVPLLADYTIPGFLCAVFVLKAFRR